jgi:hypothetical protein
VPTHLHDQDLRSLGSTSEDKNSPCHYRFIVLKPSRGSNAVEIRDVAEVTGGIVGPLHLHAPDVLFNLWTHATDLDNLTAPKKDDNSLADVDGKYC